MKIKTLNTKSIKLTGIKRYIKRFTKYLTILNIITAFIALYIGALVKNSELPIKILHYFIEFPTDFHTYLLCGFVTIIAKLGLKGIIEEFINEYFPEYLTINIGDIISSLFPQNSTMDLGDILNPESPPAGPPAAGSQPISQPSGQPGTQSTQSEQPVVMPSRPPYPHLD
jgi:hypothetical protein